jgi:two-component system, chemotaxis family, sensor histidine kinase and response regulator PixL
MLPDQEQDIQLQFLEEALDYLQTIELGLIGLEHQGLNRQQVDGLLRAAHSIKGGAAMMGFHPLSQLAHRLEDNFKVLKSGKVATTDAQLERLLLDAVDQLRQVTALHQQQIEVDQAWLQDYAIPVFDALRELLGDPQPEDELTLLSEDEGQDTRVLLFGTELEACLGNLETILDNLDSQSLFAELQMAAQQFEGLGEMLELPAFSGLCRSVTAHLETAPEQVTQIAPAALRAWRRAQALVLTGQDHMILDQLDLTLHQSLSSTIADASVEPEVNSISSSETIGSEIELEISDRRRIQSLEELLPVGTAMELKRPVTIPAAIAADDLLADTKDTQDNSIRVPMRLVEQLTDLFGELTIERNGLDLQVKQMRNVLETLQTKVRTLEQSNFRLRTTYDKVATQGLSSQEQTHPLAATTPALDQSTAISQPPLPWQRQFDVLEMDRYSDLHLLSQEVMETIVQIQEVANDLEVGLEDAESSIRGLTRTTKQMQASFTQVRMRPLSDLMAPFPRLLRDLSLENNKDVQLQVQGANILIDRVILESLTDPMMHLLRNAFDHGIESTAVRRQLGKSDQGTITISAAHRGNQTVITIADDGSGINLDKVRDRALAMGIAPEDLALASPQDLLELIFEPGFSTAAQVTDLSGRGIGMDVVRTNLQQLRGEIKVDTELHKGTTFTITVPFTLSVLRVMLVESQGLLMAFPTESISEMMALPAESLQQTDSQQTLDWEGVATPLLDLQQWLHFGRPPKPANLPTEPKIKVPSALLVNQGDRRFGLRVERYWGEQEVTIRQTDGNITLPAGFSGCTVLGDGRVVPLVDAIALCQWIEQQKAIKGSNAIRPSVLGTQLRNATTNRPTKSTILVVDDSINVRRFLAVTLEKAGYRVEQAKDGEDAIEKLKAGLSVQAVVCDVEMPRLDGYGFLTQIGNIPDHQYVPVVMLTSRSGDKHRQLALNLGAAVHLPKPFKEQELLQTLKRLIEEDARSLLGFSGGSRHDWMAARV